VQFSRESRLRRRIDLALGGLGALAERLGLAGAAASWLARPLLVPPDLRPQPVLVVLCGGCRFNGRLSEPTVARVEHGVRLWRQGLAARMILSGGRHTPHRPNCAPRMQALAERLGMDPDRILVEDRSSRTAENAREVAALARAEGITSVLLVTSALHMRRARRCFEGQGLRVACAPVPHPGPAALLAREVLHEYLGLAYYRLRGWL
jgi:uncharacterized SAM-binding protein YcdF (DUF218 family)